MGAYVFEDKVVEEIAEKKDRGRPLSFASQSSQIILTSDTRQGIILSWQSSKAI